MIPVDDPSGCAVFLDLDGTLIDIAVAPDLVHIPSDLVPLLARLSSGLRGALAIVTGRPVGDVNRFLHPLRLVTAGVHGAELRTEMNGEVLLTVDPMDTAVASAVKRLGELAPGVVIEFEALLNRRPLPVGAVGRTTDRGRAERHRRWQS